MKHLVLLMMLFLASVAHAAITIDGTPTISGGTGDFGNDSFSHTTASDANFLVVCTSTNSASSGAAGNEVTSITHNLAALTQLVTATALSEFGNQRTEMWYRLAPATGPQTIAVTVADDPWHINVAITLKDVAQSVPTNTASANAVSAAPSVTVTSAVDQFVLDCLGHTTGGNTFDDPTEGTGQTQQWFAQHDVIAHAGSTMVGASPNVTPDWALLVGGVPTATVWAQVATSLAPLAEAARRKVMGVWP